MSICAPVMSAAPLESVNANANVCDAPVPELGVTDSGASSDPLSPVMFSGAVVLWLKTPLVPVTVTVNGPLAAPLVVATVNVVEPDPTTVGGLKDPVTPEGNPDVPRMTLPLNPLLPVTVTVYVALRKRLLVAARIGCPLFQT
jgi:hypothetical protein